MHLAFSLATFTESQQQVSSFRPEPKRSSKGRTAILSRTSRRFAVLVSIGIIGVPLAVVATAFACANLASAKLSRAAATPGTQVSFMGRNFNSNAAASPVTIRWNGRNGQVLATARPASTGKVSTTFTVPNAKPGYYIIVATQTGPNGRPASGTPGRAPLRIAARRSSSSTVVVAPAPVGGGPAAPAPLIIGLGASALMLAGGFTALAVRRRRIPAGLSTTA